MVLTRYRRLAEARAEIKERVQDGTARDHLSLVCIPPAGALVSDEEDIDDKDLAPENDVAEIAGEIELHDSGGDNESDDNEPAPAPRKKRKSGKKRSPPPPNPWSAGTSKYAPSFAEMAAILPLVESFPELATLTPYQLFRRYFDEEIVELIRTQTELYAKQKNHPDFSITAKELEQYVGIMLLTGSWSFPRESMFWENGSLSAGCPAVAQAMSKNRFKEVKKFIHLADNTTADLQDRLYKVRPFRDALNVRLKQFGFFRSKLSIDEEMVPYYGTHSLKQYMRNKPVKFGYKLWNLNTASGYPFHSVVYEGKENGQLGPLGSRVVKGLLQQVPNPAAHQVFFDNFFTSKSLLEELAAIGFRATGTVRENRLERCPLPDSKVFKKQDKGAMAVCSTEKVLVVKWNDNACVSVATNFDTVDPTIKVYRYVRGGTRRELLQPRLIENYNDYMGGVDVCDRDVANYRIRTRVRKWWWPFFTNGLNLMMTAAWRIHLEVHELKDQLDHLTFRRAVHDAMLVVGTTGKPRMGRRPGPRSTVVADIRLDEVNHEPKGGQQMNRCVVCMGNARVKCTKCNVMLHKDSVNKACFSVFHSKIYTPRK